MIRLCIFIHWYRLSIVHTPVVVFVTNLPFQLSYSITMRTSVLDAQHAFQWQVCHHLDHYRPRARPLLSLQLTLVVDFNRSSVFK